MQLNNHEDQADLDRLAKVQEHLSHSIELANTRDDPLVFPLEAMSEVIELQVTTQIATRQLLHHAIRSAENINNPSAIFRKQINTSFQKIAREQWLRFAAMIGVLYAITAAIAGTLVAGAIIESHRNTPDAEVLLTASGKFPVAWATMIRQNDLLFMVTMCAKSSNVGALANGMHYCSVPLNHGRCAG